MRCHKLHQIPTSGLRPDGREGRLQFRPGFRCALARIGKHRGRTGSIQGCRHGYCCRHGCGCAYPCHLLSCMRSGGGEGRREAFFQAFGKKDVFLKSGFQESLLNLLFSHLVSVFWVVRLISCRVRDKITRALPAVMPVSRAMSSKLSPSIRRSFTILAARGGKPPMRCSR